MISSISPKKKKCVRAQFFPDILPEFKTRNMKSMVEHIEQRANNEPAIPTGSFRLLVWHLTRSNIWDLQTLWRLWKRAALQTDFIRDVSGLPKNTWRTSAMSFFYII